MTAVLVPSTPAPDYRARAVKGQVTKLRNAGTARALRHILIHDATDSRRWRAAELLCMSVERQFRLVCPGEGAGLVPLPRPWWEESS